MLKCRLSGSLSLDLNTRSFITTSGRCLASLAESGVSSDGNFGPSRSFGLVNSVLFLLDREHVSPTCPLERLELTLEAGLQTIPVTVCFF